MSEKKIVYQEDLYRAFQYYLNNVSEFLYKPATPAMVMRIQEKIEHLRLLKLNETRNEAFLVKMIVEPTPIGGSFELRPDLTNFEIRTRGRYRTV